MFFDWLGNREKTVFYLSGRAGAGKTAFIDTCLKQLEELAPGHWEVILCDFPGRRDEITTGLLPLKRLSLNGPPILVVLEGVYNAAGIGEVVETLLAARPRGLKIALASRAVPSGTWLVSPLLRQSMVHHRLGQKAVNISELSIDERFPELVVQRYLRELDEPGLLPYLETASAAWRFDRDLLHYLAGGIKPLAFRRIQRFSFVYQDSQGLYMDPRLKKAMLDCLAPQKVKKLRAGIHSFSLAESSSHHGSPMHWLNTLYTLDGDAVPRHLFQPLPPGTSVRQINRLPDGIKYWPRAIRTQLQAEALLPESSILGVCLDGEVQAAAALCDAAPELAGFQPEADRARLLWCLAYRQGMDWAVSCLVRHLLVENMMKADIITAAPEPGLAELLNALGAVPPADANGYLLLDLNKSFPEWLKSLLRGKPNPEPGTGQIVKATRRTLFQWRQPGDIQNSPLFLMHLDLAGLTSSDASEVYGRFVTILSSVLKRYRKKSPRITRIIDIVYLRRSTTLREISKESGIPERTLYRELQKAFYEIGQCVLSELRGGIKNQPA